MRVGAGGILDEAEDEKGLGRNAVLTEVRLAKRPGLGELALNREFTRARQTGEMSRGGRGESVGDGYGEVDEVRRFCR